MKSNSYTSAMVRLTVTDRLREQVLEGVDAPRPCRKGVAMPLILAACLLLVLSAGLLPRFLRSVPPVLDNNPMHKAESVAELQKSAPFPLSAPGSMPEGYEVESTYLIAGKLAQIKYASPDGSITYRMAAGTDDISGDYTQYPETSTEQIGDYSVTAKGEDGKVSLCTWTDGGYAYALSFSTPVSPEAAHSVVESVCPIA